MALSDLQMLEISAQVWSQALTKAISQFNQRLDTCFTMTEVDRAMENMIQFKEYLDYVQENVTYHREKLLSAQKTKLRE